MHDTLNFELKFTEMVIEPKGDNDNVMKLNVDLDSWNLNGMFWGKCIVYIKMTRNDNGQKLIAILRNHKFHTSIFYLSLRHEAWKLDTMMGTYRQKQNKD